MTSTTPTRARAGSRRTPRIATSCRRATSTRSWRRLTGVGTDAFRITVDDGGLSYYTHIADRLEAHGWRGLCFVTTDFIGTRGFLDAAQIRELDARGHVIGSHSTSHPARFSALRARRDAAEWTLSRHVLEDILGHAVDVASVPGGYYSRTVAQCGRRGWPAHAVHV